MVALCLLLVMYVAAGFSFILKLLSPQFAKRRGSTTLLRNAKAEGPRKCDDLIEGKHIVKVPVKAYRLVEQPRRKMSIY